MSVLPTTASSVESADLCVRPYWQPDGPELSKRAALLLLAEWRRLGLIDPAVDDDAEGLLQGMQHRGTVVAIDKARPRKAEVATSYDAGPVDAKPAAWPVLEGCLVPWGERAYIGTEPDGSHVLERFLPGSVQLPSHGMAVLNVAHDRAALVGRITRVEDRADGAYIVARVVDSTGTGHDAAELVKAGVLGSLSIEFLPDRATMQVTATEGGGRLVTHRQVYLHAAALVPLPAYPSATVSRLLDRHAAGRQREAARRKAIAQLEAMSA